MEEPSSIPFEDDDSAISSCVSSEMEDARKAVAKMVSEAEAEAVESYGVIRGRLVTPRT